MEPLWSPTGGALEPAFLGSEGMLGAGGLAGSGLFAAPAPTGPAAAPPGRGEFAAGFLWFDAFDPQPAGDGRATAPAPAPAARMGQPVQLPLAHIEVQQVGEAFQPMDPASAAPPALPLAAGQALPVPLPVGPPASQVQLVPCQQQQEAAAAAEALPAAAAGGRKARSGRSGTSEEERRARNRATQARFRERQKAKNEQLAVEHAATEAELGRARSQQHDLNTQNTVLQKLLAVRDGALAALGGAPGDPPAPRLQPQPRTQLAAPPAAAAGLGAAAAAAGGGARGPLAPGDRNGSGLSSTVQQHMEWLGNELTAHMAMLELPPNVHPDEAMRIAHASLAPLLEQSPLPPLQEGEMLQLTGLAAQRATDAIYQATASCVSGDAGPTASDAASPSPASSSHDSFSTASGAVQPARQDSGIPALLRGRPDLVQRVMAMGPEEFLADWQDKSRAFKELLERHDLNQSMADLEHLLDIFRSWGGTLSLTLHLKPENAQALFATAADAPDGTWETVAAALQPTRAQRTMLQQLWHAFAGRAHAIRTERAAAVAAVQHAAQGMASATVTPHSLPASTLGGLMSQYLDLFDAAGKLSSLQDAEFVAMLQLMGRVGAVFSPMQKARAVATCYPCFPDTVQILRALCDTSLAHPQAPALQEAATAQAGA